MPNTTYLIQFYRADNNKPIVLNLNMIESVTVGEKSGTTDIVMSSGDKWTLTQRYADVLMKLEGVTPP